MPSERSGPTDDSGRGASGRTRFVFAVRLDDVELEESWIEGQDGARWRTATVHGPGTGADASGSSLLEVPPACVLARHTDSAEELIVVLSGEAEAAVGDESKLVVAGGMALVPKDVPHEVRNVGEGDLRFLALYADTDVTTTYGAPVEPGGERERTPVA